MKEGSREIHIVRAEKGEGRAITEFVKSVKATMGDESDWLFLNNSEDEMRRIDNGTDIAYRAVCADTGDTAGVLIVEIPSRFGGENLGTYIGLSEEELNDFGDLAKANDCGVFIASNFAIGAVLMMKFAAEAIKYMPYAEVIEMHHDHKKDAPSGTAVQTLKKMAENRESFRQGAEDEFEKIEGSRGGEYEGMRVHSVRLPGYVAHQEVMFGGLGQILTIRHDSITRESFIPGIMLAVKKVGDIKGLLSGLENIM